MSVSINEASKNLLRVMKDRPEVVGVCVRYNGIEETMTLYLTSEIENIPSTINGFNFGIKIIED